MGSNSRGGLVIRADGSESIGIGHVMRCLAIAQAWKTALPESPVKYVCAELSDSLRERLLSLDIDVCKISAPPGTKEDAEQTINSLGQTSPQWIVLDGYLFSYEYVARLRSVGARILMIDDFGHADGCDVDAILNQNIYAARDRFSSSNDQTHFWLGGKYAMLREEFSSWCDWNRNTTPTAQKLLVTMGGADSANVSGNVLRALSQTPERQLHVAVLVGSANPHLGELKSLAQAVPYSVELVQNTTDMPKWLAWADIAISAAGSTCLEMAFMQLPMINLIIADNQIEVAEAMHREELSVNLGWYSECDYRKLAEQTAQLIVDLDRRQRMSERGRQLVDGKGARRVVNSMRACDLQLRRATEDDCQLLWQWRNDPTVRATTFTDNLVPLDSHQVWFRNRLEDEQCQLLIGEDSDRTPVGQIRFDIKQDEAEISISIAREQRGHGYGTSLIRLATEELFSRSAVRCVNAFIRQDNTASQRMFDKAGFCLSGEMDIRGKPAVCYSKGNPKS